MTTTNYSEIEATEVAILSREQIEDGTCNDQPNTVFEVQLPDGTTGWMAGPHGVFECAISSWLANVGKPAASRELAISIGCE